MIINLHISQTYILNVWDFFSNVQAIYTWESHHDSYDDDDDHHHHYITIKIIITTTNHHHHNHSSVNMMMMMMMIRTWKGETFLFDHLILLSFSNISFRSICIYIGFIIIIWMDRKKNLEWTKKKNNIGSILF